jgi:group I intron endonuclease
MNIGIYKITSPSNKIYIGQSIDVKSRKNQYKRLNCKKQPKLYNSLKKYGWEQHEFDIIEECSLEQLNEKEIYWKQHYVNFYGWDKMLFCELVDAHTGGKRSKETKKKMSESRKGKKDTEETKIKKREANLGKHSGKRPEGTGEKISKANLGKSKSKETKFKIEQSITKTLGKSVICYNMDGTIYGIFPSLNKASREMNLSLSSITLCCQGKKYKKVGNYIFKYNL